MKKTFKTCYGEVVIKDVLIDFENHLEEGIDILDTNGEHITSVIGVFVYDLEVEGVEEILENNI